MKRETFCKHNLKFLFNKDSAFAEGIASIISELANYPISRFNLTLKVKFICK